MCTRSIATRTLLSIVALIGATAATTARGQDDAEAAPPAPPVVIDADNSFYDLRAGLTRFEDNVSISRGPMAVQADQGVLRQVDGQITDVELEGSPIRWRDQLSDGSIVTGESLEMHFDVLANVVTLTGGAVIRHQQGEFTGDELVYDLDAESLAGRSTGSERVRVVIEPEAMSGSDAAPTDTPDAGEPETDLEDRIAITPDAGDDGAAENAAASDRNPDVVAGTETATESESEQLPVENDEDESTEDPDADPPANGGPTTDPDGR